MLMLAGLANCASNTGPVVIRDSNTGSRIVVDKKLEKQQRRNKPYQKDSQKVNQNQERNKKNIESVKSVIPGALVSDADLPIKQKLLEQSQGAMKNKKYQSAIAVAERGLRVDRKEPRFYQVLAAAYAAINNNKQSTYFAKQGLRYAKKGSLAYQSLQQWLR